MILYEHRPDLVRVGAPKLVLAGDLEDLTGFRSLMGFPDETIKSIVRAGNTKGLADYRLFADDLILDFDDSPRAYNLALSKLDELGLYHSAYDTGGRGYHIHISMVPVYGYSLATRMKAYVVKRFPGADANIYKASGIIRLNNTIHRKTGRAKELLFHKAGSPLTLPELPISKKILPQTDRSRDTKSLGIHLAMLLGVYPTKGEDGGRNLHCFNIALTCRDLKLDKDKTTKVISAWNSKLSSGLCYGEILKTVNSAYGKI